MQGRTALRIAHSLGVHHQEIIMTWNRLRRAALPWLVCGALALGTVVLASPEVARADEGASGTLRDSSFHARPQMVSVFTGFLLNRFVSYGFPFTIGGRYYYPIVPTGFIPSLNDEFGIEGGLDFLFLFGHDTYAGFSIPIDAMWDFHFSPTFDAYAKLGFLFGNVFGSGYRYGGFWFDFRPAVGLRLKLTDTLYFRAEAGYPAIMAGLGFAF
jgi:hypothetical protein